MHPIMGWLFVLPTSCNLEEVSDLPAQSIKINLSILLLSYCAHRGDSFIASVAASFSGVKGRATIVYCTK